jgi:hypothetical protein
MEESRRAAATEYMTVGEKYTRGIIATALIKSTQSQQ